jgi:FMN phosphatase YigB (HAD superfamily)
MISHIYFDWSGTLVKSDNMLRRTRKKGDCKLLYSDTRIMLQYLYDSGYTLGLITNSDKPVGYLLKCLTKYNISQYFNGAIVTASMNKMKEKPNTFMFKKALNIDKILPKEALMVGNKCGVDIIGAKKAGLHTALLDRMQSSKSLCPQDIYIQSLLELGLYLL